MRCWRSVPDIRQFISPAVAWRQVRWGCPISVFLLILANITEFGATPLFTTDELRSAHVAMALYPLSAFRAMNRAAEHVYNVLRQEGTQKSVIDTMQTRNELYESINYYQYEEKLDDLFARSQVK